MNGKYSRVPKPPPGTRSRSTLHRLLQPRDTSDLALSTATEFHKVHFSPHPPIYSTHWLIPVKAFLFPCQSVMTETEQG